ncbi:MAG: hypothetical protein WBX17_07065 [Microbacterium sp.]
MHAHIESIKVELVASLRRDARTLIRRHGPRRARGTFVPAATELPAMRLAH